MIRLSDRQYKLFVRSGIMTVIAAVLAFDRVPPEYQHTLMALALVGAAVGFFPFATSRPFERIKNEDSAQPDLGTETPTVSARATEVVSVPKARLNLILTEAALRDMQRMSRQKELGSYYYQELSRPTLRSYLAALAQNLDERQARVNEVHDLIEKLKGTPKKFSIQLTSDNTIIVHCESEQAVPRRSVEFETEARSLGANEAIKGEYVN